MDSSSPSTEPREGVRSIERAIDVLFSFTQQPVLDIASLQAQTGLTRPTLYRLLATLENRGLVYSFGSPRRFQLGFRFGVLANSWTQRPALVSIASDLLEKLWSETRETVALIMPVSATHRMCVFELKSPQAISFSRGIGYTEPLSRGASGKVLLAYLSHEHQKVALESCTRKQRDAILVELESARRDGILVTHAEIIPGSVALASPVLTPSGEVLAAVCIFGTELRLRGAVMQSCQKALRRTAKEISRLL